MTVIRLPADIVSITADSRQVRPGSAFFAYPGPQRDGRAFIPQAIAQGATLVLWDPEAFSWQPSWQVRAQAVPQLQAQVGAIASDFFQAPSHAMWCIGVTGTNGKTTVSHWCAQAYTALQTPVAVMGTLGNGPLNALVPSPNTTLGAIDCQALLAQFRDAATEVVAMEVSSHGLDQGRVNGVAFDIAIFTNLSRDHLDYHQTMAAYQAAKRQLFDWPTLRMSVLNINDAVGRAFYDELHALGRPVLSVGLHAGDIHTTQSRVGPAGIAVDVMTPVGKGNFVLQALGDFNLNNALLVLASLLAHGVALEAACHAISQLRPVAGRMQQFGGGTQPLVVVDYAHTPDALEKALSTLRTLHPRQLHCVFGCGGDRDVGKRAQMGAVASRFADVIVLTNDNPRSESPTAIAEMIAAGITGHYQYTADRAHAITQAIAHAQAGDIVLIAGKGHETYQETQGVLAPFSDSAVVMQALQATSTGEAPPSIGHASVRQEVQS